MNRAIQQKPTDLVLTIANTSVQHNSSVLCEETLLFGEYWFTFSIIGESHTTLIRKGDQPILQEILACIDLPRQNLVHTQHFHDLNMRQYKRNCYGITVSFNDQLEWKPNPDSNSIEARFPNVYGKTPLTRVHWYQTNDTIFWWTLHVYPEKNITTHVYTTSYFNRKDFLCL